ncbi:hypothetical protein MPSEU_000129700 [Mayamaea pseudoterrestris]|nr:hypothetical protein MPSEU_000129700 [Mayamaea pseudoterrestris]
MHNASRRLRGQHVPTGTLLFVVCFVILSILNTPMTWRTTRATRVDYFKSTITPAENVPVFYNLFVANESDSERVRQLVDDQLSALLPEHSVYMHSIGYPLQIPNVTLLQHHDDGDEVVTLHSLWQYCKVQPNSKVIYMHSKGSFHSTPENEQLRRFLTAGALSEECLHLPDTCNLCASRMSPVPHPHVPGNMWLARCQYIRRLIDPLVFQEEMRSVTYIPKHTKRLHCYGIGRFAAEHWVLSHPANRPCDLSDDSSFSYGYNAIPPSNFKKQLKMAPRFAHEFYSPLDTRRVRVVRGKPVSSLPIGSSRNDRLIEYQQLYNETPSKDWWGWKHYNIKEEALS